MTTTLCPSIIVIFINNKVFPTIPSFVTLIKTLPFYISSSCHISKSKPSYRTCLYSTSLILSLRPSPINVTLLSLTVVTFTGTTNKISCILLSYKFPATKGTPAITWCIRKLIPVNTYRILTSSNAVRNMNDIIRFPCTFNVFAFLPYELSTSFL